MKKEKNGKGFLMNVRIKRILSIVLIVAVIILIDDEYCSAIEVSYHYMGSKMPDTEKKQGAEWTRQV